MAGSAPWLAGNSRDKLWKERPRSSCAQLWISHLKCWNHSYLQQVEAVKVYPKAAGQTMMFQTREAPWPFLESMTRESRWLVFINFPFCCFIFNVLQCHPPKHRILIWWMVSDKIATWMDDHSPSNKSKCRKYNDNSPKRRGSTNKVWIVWKEGSKREMTWQGLLRLGQHITSSVIKEHD